MLSGSDEYEVDILKIWIRVRNSDCTWITWREESEEATMEFSIVKKWAKGTRGRRTPTTLYRTSLVGHITCCEANCTFQWRRIWNWSIAEILGLQRQTKGCWIAMEVPRLWYWVPGQMNWQLVPCIIENCREGRYGIKHCCKMQGKPVLHDWVT